MEYRRRRKRRSRSAGNGGFEIAVKLLVLIVIFLATAKLLANAGVGSALKEKMTRTLVSGCTGSKTGDIFMATNIPDSYSKNTESPSPAPTGKKADIELKGIDIYMIQMGFYESDEECTAAAAELKQMGAAGFILNDNGSLRLIASAYSDRASAESVAERLKNEGYECLIYEKRFNGVDLELTASEERCEEIERAMELCYEIPKELDDLAIDNDKNSREAEYVMSRLAVLRGKVREAAENIGSDAKLNGMLSRVESCLRTYLQLIGDAAGSEAGAALSSELKNIRIASALSYGKLLKDLGE